MSSALSQFETEHVDQAAMALQTMETWIPDLAQAVKKAQTLAEVEEIRSALKPFVRDLLRIQDEAAEKLETMLKARP